MSSPPTTRREPLGSGAELTGATTIDDFLGGRISLVQPLHGHRAGSDAVLLQAAVPALAGERVLDAGAGVGTAGFCLLARVPELDLTAVEIDAELCALAASNSLKNGFADQFKVIEADVTAPQKSLRAKGLLREGYDQLIANPPFHQQGTVRAAPHPGRAAAHVMGEGTHESWLRFLAAFAAPKARLTLIHRPEYLAMLLRQLEGRFGEIAIFPLFPKKGEPAVRIILQGRKGSKAAPRLLQGLILHEPDGRYTEQADAVLRRGDALVVGS
jgi:tRNA1(Val) A37 N6-methylase TrmN6